MPEFAWEAEPQWVVEPVETTTPSLWAWPERARFGRVIPKTKFYEHAEMTTRLRDLFVRKIASVRWAFKLDSTTVGLSATDDVSEIEVLEISLKHEVNNLPDEVLAIINRVIPSPVVFELDRETSLVPGADSPQREVRFSAAPSKSKLAPFFSTTWLPITTQRAPLPVSLDLGGLHAALLAPVLPVMPSPGESLAVSALRAAEVVRLDRVIAGLERKLRNEPQLNRQLEIRRDLRARCAERDRLTVG